MLRRDLLKLALLAGASALTPLVRAAEAGFKTLAQPEPVAVPGKIEVIEFFSFGCPHCKEFDPELGEWLKTVPKDVNFIRVPVSFGHQQWADLSRMYYTLQVMGLEDRLHAAVFKALHEERKPIYRDADRAKWLAAQGVDSAKFDDTFKSFGIQTKVQRAEQMVASYKVDGVPEMAVAGKYTVSVPEGGSFKDMLATVDTLIGRARGELPR